MERERGRIRKAARRVPGASLLLFAAAVAVFAIPTASDRLQYDRAAVAAGEVWRIVTCHGTHFSFDHLVWDALVFVVLGALCERAHRGRFLACVGGAAILIPLAVGALLPGLRVYRGLSGIDSALFAMLAVTLLRERLAEGSRGGVAAVTAAGIAFFAKVGYEMATGATVFVDSAAAGMVPVPLAHVVGAATGVLAGLAGSRRPSPAPAAGA